MPFTNTNIFIFTNNVFMYFECYRMQLQYVQSFLPRKLNERGKFDFISCFSSIILWITCRSNVELIHLIFIPTSACCRQFRFETLKAKFSFGNFYYFESSMPTDHTTSITGSECLLFFFNELMKNVRGGGTPDIFKKLIKNIN